MKKIIIWLFIAGFIFACNNATESKTTTKDSSSTAKDSSGKDTSNPNAPAATNGQY